MAALEAFWVLNTSTIASYKLVSYKKECSMQYAIKKLTYYI